MPKNRKAPQKTSSKAPFTLAPTETEAGLTWLSSLTEDVFRDEVLEDLFRKMQKAGALAWNENIHGRNDKGVDHLIVPNSEFGQRIVGVQVKSKPITRTGGGNTLSSLDIKRECEGAMAHEFDVQSNKARLDNIEVWTSAHITEDAEDEFSAPGGLLKVRVVKAIQVFSLLERFCPDLLKRVPGCALAVYVRDRKNPPAKKIKLLGCSLDPKKHFLEPLFSKSPAGSMGNVYTVNHTLRKKQADVALNDIVSGAEHALIIAPELSGKTYLLDHVECLIAESKSIPVRLTKDAFNQGKPHSIYSLIAKQLGFYSPLEIERIVQDVRIFLLVDDMHSLSEEIRNFLFSQDSKQVKVFATARRIAVPKDAETYYITGVNLAGITRFLRTLDVGISESKAFIDRAHSFIGRTLSTSGLPSTPFTISMMLAECENSPQKFSTPTMGRLIERFVEMQLGSHADVTNRVDFETKRELLTKFGGRREIGFSETTFRREIAKFIEIRSHPHKLDDFVADLESSGVFTFKDGGVHWSHPALKQYYWVKNLVSKGNLQPILKKLQKGMDVTLAALTGSQLKNGAMAIDCLVEDLKKIKLPKPDKLLEAVHETGVFRFMESDEEEDKWLASLEEQVINWKSGDNDKMHPLVAMAETSMLAQDTGELEHSEKSLENVEKKPEIVLDEETKLKLKRDLEPLMLQLTESKLHIAFNLAALLVNARDTKAQKKEDSIRYIIAANQFIGWWFRQMIELFFSDKKKTKADLTGAQAFVQLQLSDTMIGDPFLVEVFRKLLRRAKNEEEIIMLLDLLLCCGEDDYDFIVEKIKTVKNPSFVVAFYLRVAILYFFRFHRDKDKKFLRNLLKDIRKNSKAVQLLPVS